MKKVVRTVWISVLSGLAFLTACCTSKSLSKQERKQLVKERDAIQETLKSREGACVYGTPEVMAEYRLETVRIQSKLDSINYKLGEDVDLEKSARRVSLQEQISDLQKAITRRESACVYGSPEVIQEYGEETRRMRTDLENLRNQLKELDNPEGTKINDGKVEALYGAPVPEE